MTFARHAMTMRRKTRRKTTRSDREARPTPLKAARRRRSTATVARTRWRVEDRPRFVNLLVRSTQGLTWTPALLQLLLEELYVEEEIAGLFPSTNHPVETIAQIVAVAVALRHSWHMDDFHRTLRRLSLINVGRG